ncbi:MAG TPA: PAS domain S-box protein, partial [Polyangiaceae bacterium]
TVRLRKDGRAICISLTVSPILDATGTLVGISSIARDISERKRLEQLQHEASAYARNLIEASLDPLLTISVNGKITDANEATLKVTGVPRERLIGTDFCDYFTEARTARQGYLEVLSLGFVTDHFLTARHTNGQLTDLLLNASLYKNARGEVLGVFVAARDVTARRTAEARVSKELERLVELERFKQLTVGRELKMIDLKRQNGELTRALEALKAAPVAARVVHQ